MEVLGVVGHRVRLYSSLLAGTAVHAGTQLYRAITRQQHPLQWPPGQEWSVAMMKTLFTIGSYNHWRNFIKLFMVSIPVPDLEITCVPGSTFSTPGFRSSWWLELKPELQPKSPKASLVVMYLHGGAFMAGHPLMYKPAYKLWMQQLAEQGIHMRILAVGYPLAPEHPFPAGLHGVAEAYDWLVQQLDGSEQILLAGDSAGGNLTITSLAYMRDRAAGTVQGPAAQPVAAAAGSPQQQQQQQPGRPAFHPPLAAIMISPATDFTNSSVFRRGLPEQAQEQLQQQKQQSSTQGSAASDGGSATGGSSSSRSSRRNSTEELFHYDYVSKGEGNDVIRLYLPPPHDASGLSDPLVSPIFLKNFSGLVRRELLVVTGGCEAMVPDIHRFVARVKDVSPELLVTHHVEEAEPHCYCVLHTGKLLDKGAAVLLPFMMRMCSGSSSTGSIARPA